MYTYKLGGMLITDELYHDDLEAMTFGRKDQNELMHYGIKGQSWGKRRFQNEDGSLTMAGRNRYDVGDPLKGVTGFADTGGRGGSGVNYNRLPGGTGGSTRSATANQAPARLVGSNSRGRATTSSTTTQKVANTTNAGRKAADSLFGRIGNWASNAAKDVGNFATNAYNDASKAVSNAANAAGSWVGNTVKDVGNLLSNEDEKKAAENAQNRANRALNNAINRSGEFVPDGRGGEDLYIRDANDAKMVEAAEQQAAKAQQRFDDHPVTQVQNAAKDAGNWLGNAFNDAKNWVGNAGRDVGNFATNAYNDASKAVTNAAQDVGNFVKNAPQNISDWYTGDKAGREAQRYDNVVQNFERNGDQNINAGQDIISRGLEYPESAYDLESGQSMRDKTVIEGLDRRNLGYDQHDIARQYGQKANEAQARYDAAPRQLLERAGNWVGDRAKDVGDAASNIWDDVSATARGVADSVGNRLTGNIDRNTAESLRRTADFQEDPNAPFHAMGEQYTPENLRRQADEYQQRADNSLFGRIGNAAKDISDWTSNAASDVRDWGAGALDKGRQAFENLFGRSEPPKAELSDPTPRTFTENVITEQRIPEQRITENRIEEQRLPEAIIREGDKYRQMTPDQRQARMDSQKNRPTVSGSNNVQTWDNGNINTWDNVKTFGDPDMVNTIKMLNDNGFFNRGSSSNSGNSSSMSDKPSNVSDEYWRDYTSNGGTRESYDREMNSRKNSQNNQNSSASRQEVVGTVDNSRPYHFTYDPASGQTIVVYDDEKRR